MTIDKMMNGDELTLSLKGRLDTTTSPELETVLDESFADIKKLVLDFAEVEYISSAGLRVLLKAQKQMNGQGEMKLFHVNEAIMDVFEITGFVEILTIE